MSLEQIATLIASRAVSVREVTAAALARGDSLAPVLNCHITRMHERAMAQAVALDRLLDAGTTLGPLHGVPVSVKDSLSTAGVRTTAGAALFAEHIPEADAECVLRLRNAGAVLIAKDNMYDMAYGGPNPLYGAVRNPWNLDRTCGGSSSGSASAVAARLSAASLGTDAGGSTRMPSAFCGVVGVKPTYGLVPSGGEIPCPSSLAAIGPIARTVRDAAHVLSVVQDRSAGNSRSMLADIEGGVRGLTLGIPRRSDTDVISDEIDELVDAARRRLEAEGARLVEINLPEFTLFRAMMWVIVGVEFTSCLRRLLRESPDRLHPWTRAQLERGEYVPGTDYVQAQRVRRKFMEEVRSALRDIDALVLATVPAAAFPLPKPEVLEVGGVAEEPLNMSVRFTAPFNCLGLPALTMPCGLTGEGLPAGLQVVARAHDEPSLFRVARAYERVNPFFELVPAAVRRGRSTAIHLPVAESREPPPEK